MNKNIEKEINKIYEEVFKKVFKTAKKQNKLLDRKAINKIILRLENSKKYKEFCEVLYADGQYEYKLDIFDSVGLSFDDGTVEIYEKVGNDYITTYDLLQKWIEKHLGSEIYF